MKRIGIILISALVASSSLAQNQNDKAKFIESKPGYYQNTIMKGIAEDEDAPVKNKKAKYMKMDIIGMDIPNKVEDYTTWWRNLPISQGNTGTCWSFSTTSFYESEVYRITQQNIKLSELYTVYWEYVEKAKEYVRTRGESLFDEGSEANAVKRIMKIYGAMPLNQYDGLPGAKRFHNHSKMMEEMRTYLESVKNSSAWDETTVISTIKSILNHYLDTPPTMVTHNGKNITPQQFLSSVCKINPDDYIDVMSLMEQPYWQKAEYNVPDNWWHDNTYHNVPLDIFMDILKKSIKAGYSLTIGGDVSEPGMNVDNVCMIPSWDIPSAYITEEAREFRFYNKTTTDDHGMHLVGWTERNGKLWFLVKDSGAGSRNIDKENSNFGYYFMHEDYVKLKIMDFLVHKDMLKDIMEKFK